MEDPKLAWLTVNHRCNLQCKWCYQRELNGRGASMLKETAKGLVNLLADFKPRLIVLIGGEPTLWNHYFTLAKHIRSKGIGVTVVSNGLAFSNQKFLDKSVRDGVTNVTVSVKAFSKEGYEEACGSPSGYDVVRRALKNLKRSPIKTMISITVAYPIIERWEEMIDFIEEFKNGFYSFSFEKPVILSNGQITFDDRMLPAKIAPFIQKTMYPSLIKSGVDFKAEFVFPHCHFSQEFIDSVEESNHIFGGCLLIRSNGVVFDPNGFVLPCNHFVGYPLGQYGIDFKSSKEFLAWRLSPEISQFYEQSNNSPCKTCVQCERWTKCGAGCRLWWLYRGSQELINNNVSSVQRSFV